jgi:ABC-2 type transport system ATP-binding protein
MIETFRLTKIYSGNILALDEVTFKLMGSGGIIGRNGAGKTTLTRILSTQIKPTRGEAFVNGLNVIKEAKKVREVICSIPQEARPVGFATPWEHVVMYLVARGFSISDARESARKAMKEVGLYEYKDLPSDILSGGTKRKIYVAMALASNAEIIFLDEPTVGLDPISRLEVWSAIKILKKTSKIVLTTHYMDEAQELCDQIVLLKRGKVIAIGSPMELIKPLKNMVRVESFDRGEYRIGKIFISYVPKDKAKELIDIGVSIKPITLEDAFIIYSKGEWDEDISEN